MDWSYDVRDQKRSTVIMVKIAVSIRSWWVIVFVTVRTII